MNVVRCVIVLLCTLAMIPFILVGMSIVLLGYPFAVLGSLLGEDRVMTVDDYIVMVTRDYW